MKRILTLHLLLIISTHSIPEENDSLQTRKILKIIHFQFDASNPGITSAEVLPPLLAALKNYFRVDSIINLEARGVFWTSELSNTPIVWSVKNAKKIERLQDSAAAQNAKLASAKKLSEEDMAVLKNDLTPPIVHIQFEHWIGDLLGGFIKGKRHVLKLVISLYDQQGNRIFKISKKNSCCSNVSFGSGNATIRRLDHDSFLDLYLSVIRKFSDSQ